MRNHPPTSEELLNLVGLIYAAAMNPGELPAMLRQFNEILGSPVSRNIDSSRGLASIATSIGALETAMFDHWLSDALCWLLPHLDKAALIAATYRKQALAGESVLEMLKVLPMPCLFTDHQGRCIERNDAFNEAADVMSVRLIVGRVRFADSDLQQTWETALSDTYLTAAGQTIVTNGTNGRSWRIHLVPLRSVMPSGGDEIDAKMIMAVFDERPLEALISQEVIQSTAKLTRAELDVLAGLLQGLPAKAIASQRGASVNTVRAQIMAILDKTGHSSQRELMASFSNSTFGNSSFSNSTFGNSSFGPSSFKVPNPGDSSLGPGASRTQIPTRRG